jgi:glycosyltransferase involved in cell wall biosynthesis
MAQHRPDVSVVMTAHSKPERLALALAGVIGQRGIAFEFIIVADGASPEVMEQIDRAQQDHSITLIETRNHGRASARNMGALAAKSDTLVFLDDDILIQSDFLRRHLTAQSATPGLVKGKLREVPGLIKVRDPQRGGRGCKPIDPDALKAGIWTHDDIRMMANTLEQAVEHDIVQHVPWIASAGANLSVAWQVWADVGGFDPAYGVNWGLEDIDFGHTLHTRGIPITFCAEALGLHMSHGRPGRWEEQNRNWQRFLEKVATPDAAALRYLLAADGSVARFVDALDQIRQTG